MRRLNKEIFCAMLEIKNTKVKGKNYELPSTLSLRLEDAIANTQATVLE